MVEKTLQGVRSVYCRTPGKAVQNGGRMKCNFTKQTEEIATEELDHIEFLGDHSTRVNQCDAQDHATCLDVIYKRDIVCDVITGPSIGRYAKCR